MAIEIWKDIPGYEGFYQASNLGNIRSVTRQARFLSKKHGEFYRPSYGRVLKQTESKQNRRRSVMLSVCGSQKRMAVHRLVALTFVDNPDPDRFTEINHKDENPANNAPENLEWCDRWYNMHYGTCQQRIVESNQKRKRPVIAVLPDGTIKRYGAVRYVKTDGYDTSGVNYSIKKNKPYKGVMWFYEQP